MSNVADNSARSVPRAHHFRAALAAGQQRQRIDHDGLARAGFAREHGEAGANFEIDEIDDGESRICRWVSMAYSDWLKPPRPQ